MNMAAMRSSSHADASNGHQPAQQEGSGEAMPSSLPRRLGQGFKRPRQQPPPQQNVTVCPLPEDHGSSAGPAALTTLGNDSGPGTAHGMVQDVVPLAEQHDDSADAMCEDVIPETPQSSQQLLSDPEDAGVPSSLEPCHGQGAREDAASVGHAKEAAATTLSSAQEDVVSSPDFIPGTPDENCMPSSRTVSRMMTVSKSGSDAPQRQDQSSHGVGDAQAQAPAARRSIPLEAQQDSAGIQQSAAAASGRRLNAHAEIITPSAQACARDYDDFLDTTAVQGDCDVIASCSRFGPPTMSYTPASSRSVSTLKMRPFARGEGTSPSILAEAVKARDGDSVGMNVSRGNMMLVTSSSAGAYSAAGEHDNNSFQANSSGFATTLSLDQWTGGTPGVQATISTAPMEQWSRGGAAPANHGADGAQHVRGIDSTPCAPSTESGGMPEDVWFSLKVPPACVEIWKSRGIMCPFAWQAECLSLPCLSHNRNLVYSLPTSAGKTFVAEMLLVRKMASANPGCPHPKCMLVEPYVSITVEKTESLRPFGEVMGFEIEAFHGHFGQLPLPKRTRQLCVATIERAEKVLSVMLEEDRLDELRLVVVDELHFCGESGRGPILEVFLTRVRRFCPHAQIICMSATVPNLEDFACWLDAEIFQCNFRPVELINSVKCGRNLINGSGKIVRTLPVVDKEDADHLHLLVSEVAKEHSVLVFCSTKVQVENVAKSLVSRKSEPPDVRLAERRSALVDDLKASGTLITSSLKAMIGAGVSFHHGGLSSDERSLVEAAFKERTISVLVATTTLAAGVNLPARRVIIRAPYIARDFICGGRFLQMSGRAGRVGMDTVGEAILMCTEKEKDRCISLLASPVPPVRSTLAEGGWGEGSWAGHAQAPVDESRPKEGSAYARTVLGCIVNIHAIRSNASEQAVKKGYGALSVHVTFDDIVGFMSSTLHGIQAGKVDAASLTAVLEWLATEGFITGDAASGLYTPLPLGKAAQQSALPPEAAKVIWSDIVRAREQGIILADDLHLLFLITPFDRTREPCWQSFALMFQTFSADRARVVERVGVEERMVALKGQQRSMKRSNEAYVLERSAKRLYAAMILNELVNEASFESIQSTYSDNSVVGGGKTARIDRGYLEELQTNSATFSHMVTNFASMVGFDDVSELLRGLTGRIAFGVRPDLLPLCEIPFVKAARARTLFRAGLRSAKDISGSTPADLVKIMGNTLGAKPLQTTETIIISAKRVLRVQVEAKRRELQELTQGGA